MSGSVKVGGAFRSAGPYVKVDGTWRFAPEAWAKVSGTWKKWFLAGGLNDTDFNTQDNISGPSTTVNAIAFQSDGKIIVGGVYVNWNGVTVNRVVRLNTDGTLDTAFTTNGGTAANGTVNAITVQSNGQIIVAGNFTTWNGVTVGRIVRLSSDGVRDTTFSTNNGTGASDTVNAIAIQSDGKIVVGGVFATWNGTTVNRIVRLNSDGTRDTAFTTNTGTGAGTADNQPISAMAIQSDGKIVLFGNFNVWNGTSIGRGIVRLNSNGTRETAFNTNTGTAMGTATGQAGNAIAIQSDGKIVLGGRFSTWNGATVSGIVRLNANGTRDTAFTTNAGAAGIGGNTCYAISILSNGQIVIGGDFLNFSAVTVNRIVKLNSTGARDTTFTTNTNSTGGASNPAFTTLGSVVNAIAIRAADQRIFTGGSFTAFNNNKVNRFMALNQDGTPYDYYVTGATDDIRAIAIQPDGKIIIGGFFVSFNRQLVYRIARLNVDGTLDTAFAANTAAGFLGTANPMGVLSIAVQSDGKIILGGSFTTFNGVTVNSIVRLNSDGTRDTTFTTNTGTAGGATASITGILVQSDGKIIVGGNFTGWNGVGPLNRIVRLNSDGTRDTTFSTNVGTGANGSIQGLALQSDGKILVVGGFATFNSVTVGRVVRLNSDGTSDASFTTNTGTGADSTIQEVALQPNGQIVIGGFFATFNSVTVNRVVLLNSDGTRDATFTTNIGTGPSSFVNAIAVQANGQIVLGGDFTTFNSATVNRIVRLNSDGTRDTAFTTNAGTGLVGGAVQALAIQGDGQLLAGGLFTTFNGVIRNGIVEIGGGLAV
jgi:uncharacterized delta-60 repeat protein